MYRKNTAGQFVYFALVNKANGDALLSATVTAYRALDNGSQATATGTTTELANGQYRYNLSQADTNGDYGSYLFTATNAVPVEKTVVFTSADPTDAAAFGLTKFGDIETDTQDIQSRLPAALVSGRIDASVGAMAADTLTASALASDAVDEITLQTVNEVFAYEVEGVDNFSVMFETLYDKANAIEVDTIGIKSRLPAALIGGRMDSSVGAMAANTLTASALATDAVTEIQTGLALQTTSLAIKAKTDLITAGNISVLQDRVNDSTITMQYNESTSATVNLDEDTTAATLQFVVARPDGTDVLTIANASITRNATSFTVTITTAVTATIGQYLWSLRDLSGGGNRVVAKGVLTVQNAAAIDA